MAVILVLLCRGLQSGEEYGIADAMNLTRLDCPHAYSYQRVAVTFAYDKIRASERKLTGSRIDTTLAGLLVLLGCALLLLSVARPCRKVLTALTLGLCLNRVLRCDGSNFSFDVD
jgi:hypothetical protein